MEVTEIERKALALMNEVRTEYPATTSDRTVREIALCRAIEQHEAFRQEVSDAVERFFTVNMMPDTYRDSIGRFIIVKPDPLVEVLGPIIAKAKAGDELKPYADQLRAALAKRGLEIREIEG